MLDLRRYSDDQIKELAYSYTDAEAKRLLYDWNVWARDSQRLPSGDAWKTWLLIAGRGNGKTRTGAETIRHWARTPCRIALIAPTSRDAREVMVEGESGILACFPPEERPRYEPSRARILFRSGAIGSLYSGEEPERLRGPQHHYAWMDEFCLYPKLKLLWDNLKFGLRLGQFPRVLGTSTPKPLPFLKKLLASPTTRLSRGSTFDNAANLPDSVVDELREIYGGTNVGRQELEGQILEEAEGALWKRAMLEALRVKQAPNLTRIVVAVDPSVTSTATSDECGIVACGIDGSRPPHGYLLEDASCRLPPAQWAARVVVVARKWNADRIIAEANNGGDLVETVLRTVDTNLPFRKVHASHGKVTRAEPIAAFYEQGRIHHVGGFELLENEQCEFVPGALTTSPNRVDALVWGFSELMLKREKVGQALWLS